MAHNKHIFVTVASRSKSKFLIDIYVLIPCKEREQRTENTGEQSQYNGGQRMLERLSQYGPGNPPDRVK